MSEIPISVMPWHRPDPCKPSKNQTEAAFKATYIDYLSSLSLESPTSTVPLTGIMCTIGPASKELDMMVDMMEQGMSLALVPLALGTRQDHIDIITHLRAANMAYSQTKNRVYPLGIAVQTKGPGLRIGGLKKDVPLELPLKHKITLTTDKAWRTKGTEHHLYISFPEMCHVLNEGDHILVGLGAVLLLVETIDQNEVVCQVVQGGVIHSFMTVAVPDVPLRLPDLTDEDVDDLRLAASLGVDIVVATKTRIASHISDVRKILAEDEKSSGIQVWAQIETKEGLDNLESILEEADAILLSRVSLTQDLPPEKLFLAQKMALANCNKAGVPVFVSSHFLPSMQKSIEPSIAELNDVALAILDGADGFALRNTTSIGRHPEHTIETLAKTCLVAEAAMWHHQTFSFLNSHAPPPIDPTHAIAISAVEAALKTCASAILLATTSGRSAQLVARYRPRCPIIAVTRYGQVARQLNTWRAVIPLHYVEEPLPEWIREVDVRLQFGIEFAKMQGIVTPGDCLVLLNGWRQGAGFTNTIRVVYASDSFPWVYPHQLPPILPSDKEVAEQETSSPDSIVNASSGTPGGSKLQASSHTIPPMSSSVMSTKLRASQTSESEPKVVKLTLSKMSRPGGTLVSKELPVSSSMADEFGNILSSQSKTFSHSGLLDEFKKSKSDLIAGKMNEIQSNMSVRRSFLEKRLSEVEQTVEDIEGSDPQKEATQENQNVEAGSPQRLPSRKSQELEGSGSQKLGSIRSKDLGPEVSGDTN